MRHGRRFLRQNLHLFKQETLQQENHRMQVFECMDCNVFRVDHTQFYLKRLLWRWEGVGCHCYPLLAMLYVKKQKKRAKKQINARSKVSKCATW